MHKIDLNCDLGESFGNYKLGLDDEVIKYISSANIACGFHASDPLVMQKTVALARDNGVAVGAHPGFPDLVGFGRRNMNVSPAEAKAFVQYQIGALAAFCKAAGCRLAIENTMILHTPEVKEQLAHGQGRDSRRRHMRGCL